MVSKPKNKTYIILEIGPYGSRKTIIGRYKVGAKNEKEALVLIKSKYGKHKAFNIYYEVTDIEDKIPNGTIIKEH